MKQKNIFSIIFWIILALTQVAVASVLRVRGSEVNLITTAIVLGWFLSADERNLWLGVLVSGMVLDVYSPARFGVVTMTLVLILFTLFSIQRYFLHYSSIILAIVFSFLSSVIYDIISAIANGVLLRVSISHMMVDGIFSGAFIALCLLILVLFERRGIKNRMIYVNR